jgi:hypothetical protein
MQVSKDEGVRLRPPSKKYNEHEVSRFFTHGIHFRHCCAEGAAGAGCDGCASGAVLVVLVKMAVLVMLVTRAVLVVMVVAASSCFTNTTTTPMRVPNATNTKEATPIFMNFQQFTVKPASALLSSSF